MRPNAKAKLKSARFPPCPDCGGRSWTIIRGLSPRAFHHTLKCSNCTRKIVCGYKSIRDYLLKERKRSDVVAGRGKRILPNATVSGTGKELASEA